MATTFAAPQIQMEDPLQHLPCSNILAYKKGQVIYGHDQPPTRIYLVIDGKIKICRTGGLRRDVLVDIYHVDEFFGESALLGLPTRDEAAVALEKAHVMSWTTLEIESLVKDQPLLAIALMQIVALRSLEFGRRIESFSVDPLPRRIARMLVRFCYRLGRAAENGSVQIMPLTHELLSQYVGTTREMVSHCMNDFRRQGYIHYSRKGIAVYCDALSALLRQNPATVLAESFGDSGTRSSE